MAMRCINKRLLSWRSWTLYLALGLVLESCTQFIHSCFLKEKKRMITICRGCKKVTYFFWRKCFTVRNIKGIFNPGWLPDVDLYHLTCVSLCFAWSRRSQSHNLQGAGTIIRAGADGCLPCYALPWAPAIGPEGERRQQAGLDGPLLCPCMAVLMSPTVCPGPNISSKQN